MVGESTSASEEFSMAGSWLTDPLGLICGDSTLWMMIPVPLGGGDGGVDDGGSGVSSGVSGMAFVDKIMEVEVDLGDNLVGGS